MSRSTIRTKWLLACSLLPALAGGGNINRPAQFTYGGQGTAITGNVLGIPILISDSGPLPQPGGTRNAFMVKARVPGLLTADVLRAAAVGENAESHSEVLVTNFRIAVEGNTIVGSHLLARAVASCAFGDPSLSSASEIVGLVINGQTIVVSGEPNQRIALPNGQVILNEQGSKLVDRAGEVNVTALHIAIADMADVKISTAQASIEAVESDIPDWKGP